MSAQLVTTRQSQLPAHLQEIFGVATPDVIKEFSGGVISGFPVLSIRGKAFRLRKGGEEQVLLNERDEAVQSIDIVFVQSSPVLAKIFYDKKFAEGDNSPPTCWSGNGVKPDAAVQNPVAKACASCQNNVWGSRITDDGKKARACSDNRRMAILSVENLDAAAAGDLDAAHPMLVRIPPSSLNPLKDFVEGVLAPKGIPPYAVFVRMGFDTTVSHPKLTFKPVKHPQLDSAFLNPDQARVIANLRGSEEVKRILSAELEEYSAAGTTGNGSEGAAEGGATSTAPAAAEVPKLAPAASKPKKKAVRPAAEEEIAAASAETIDEEEDVLTTPASKPAAKKTAAPPPATDDEEDAFAAPAPQPAKKTAKKTAATATVAAAPTGDDDFDAMLDSILKV